MQMRSSVQQNFQKALRAIEKASEAQADLIFFPELQLSPFFPQYEGADGEKYLLSLEDEVVRKIAAKCRERRVMASPNMYLSENGSHYDASLFISADGAIQGVSKMVHIMQSRHFYEQDYYTPSNDGFKVYDTSFGKVGIVICFDRHLPESIRTCVALGADFILIPTATILKANLSNCMNGRFVYRRCRAVCT